MLLLQAGGISNAPACMLRYGLATALLSFTGALLEVSSTPRLQLLLMHKLDEAVRCAAASRAGLPALGLDGC